MECDCGSKWLEPQGQFVNSENKVYIALVCPVCNKLHRQWCDETEQTNLEKNLTTSEINKLDTNTD